jgi:hypothetical protein
MQVEGCQLMADVDVKVTIYPDFEKSLKTSTDLVSACEEAASEIANVARGMAPVATGRYAALIRSERFRSGARVVADAPEASFVEFGSPTQGRPGRWVFRRAAESLGFKFRKKK